MLRKKTSVHFVSAEEEGHKVLLVPTTILLYWKKILLGFVIFQSILLVIIGVFIYLKTSHHYQSELDRANFVKSQIDLRKLRESFKTIEQTMKKVNGFMEKRGLESFAMKNAGGIDEFQIQNINEITTYYEDYLKQLEEKLKLIPLGIPHHGEVTSHFGVRPNPFLGFGAETHSGIDFRGNIGDPIKSTADGKIVFTGVKGGYGNCIMIDHGYELTTLYGHLSKINVKAGDQVKLGDVVGELGNTGRSTGPHLHYEIHFKNERINPQLYTNFK